MRRVASINTKYPPELRAKILAAYKAGGTTQQVAAQYRVKVYTVAELARRAGILRPRKNHKAKPPGAYQRSQLARGARVQASRRLGQSSESKNRARTRRNAEARAQAAELLGVTEDKLPMAWRIHLDKTKLVTKSVVSTVLGGDAVRQIDEAIAELIALRVAKALEAIRG